MNTQTETKPTKKEKKIGKYVVRTILKGDKYGLNDCLTYDENNPMIEWWIVTDKSPNGYFISRYYLSTMQENPNQGIMLCGHEPDLTVKPYERKEAIDFCLSCMDNA